MSISTLNPWQVLDQLQSDSLRRYSSATKRWQPLVDISESAHDYRVLLELPGVNPDQVKVELEDSNLNISGEKQRKQEDGKQYRYRERAIGPFHRSFKLPEDADSNGISAQFDQGLLVVTIRKQEQAKPRKINIQS